MNTNLYYKSLFLITCLWYVMNLNAQAVTGIITDYNGYWKTSLTSINTVKPNNSHNLLAFTYKGIQYSTGVNNELLASHGESFVPCDFWSLPVGNISGAITSNTKVGIGAAQDGVLNGPSINPPVNDMSKYLTDGIKGLDIGTCIANLPQGTLSFYVFNVKPTAIGDGVPDIIVTQIADPSGSSFDRYEFVDQNGNRVGNYKDIVFTSISPVGNWVADFYEAKNIPMNLLTGFTHTERPLRLWAADLSEFGITSSNYSSAASFRINLCGNSDVAFVAYNYQSIGITSVLPLHLLQLKGSVEGDHSKISWQLQSNYNKDALLYLEKSTNGSQFTIVDSFHVSSQKNLYSYIDNTPHNGNNFYRLKFINQNNQVLYSSILKLPFLEKRNLTVFPNPATNTFEIRHPAATEKATIELYNSLGVLIQRRHPAQGVQQTRFAALKIPAGVYYIIWKDEVLLKHSLLITN